MVACPNCGREIVGGLHRHLPTCLKRPPAETLVREYRSGISTNGLSHQYGVSTNTITIWLNDAGCTYRHHRKVAVKSIRVYPELAPGYGQKHRMGCENCPGYDYCVELLDGISWVLCEAPDEGQMHYWEVSGVDIEAIADEVRMITPRLWAE